MGESSRWPDDVAELAAHGAPVSSTPTTRGGEVWRRYLERVANGDEIAFTRFFDESSPLVYGIALRMLADPADAEEVASDVYLHVWRSAGSFDARRGNAAGWLAMLTRSRAIDRIRTRSAKRRLETPMEESETPRAGSAEDALFEAERREVCAALLSLPPEQRELIDLAFFGGFTHSELAAKLGLPLGTVKTRIRLAMGRLRSVLRVVLDPS